MNIKRKSNKERIEISKKKYEGVVFESLYFGDFKVLEYTNSKKILVEFIATGFRKYCQIKEVLNGKITDRLVPSVSGVGVLGNKYPTIYYNSDGKKMNLKHYETWSGMLKRCYNQKHQEKMQHIKVVLHPRTSNLTHTFMSGVKDK